MDHTTAAQRSAPSMSNWFCRLQNTEGCGGSKEHRERWINGVERKREKEGKSGGGWGVGGSEEIQDEYQVNGKNRRDDKKEGKDTGGKQDHSRSG